MYKCIPVKTRTVYNSNNYILKNILYVYQERKPTGKPKGIMPRNSLLWTNLIVLLIEHISLWLKSLSM